MPEDFPVSVFSNSIMSILEIIWCTEHPHTKLSSFFLHCPLYLVHRNSLLSEVSDTLNIDVTQLPDDHLCNLLLFGSPKFNKIANRMILDATVRFSVNTNRF